MYSPFTGTIADVTKLTGGTISSLGKGTITSVGTAVGLGTVTNVGSITNIGTIKGIDSVTIGDITGGTIDLITKLGGGTVSSLGKGTITSVTDVAQLTKGTITGLSKGTISAGTVQVSAGTVASVGTVPGIGTISAVGVIHNAGSIAGLPDLPGGTVDEVTLLKAGTVQINPKSPTQIVTASALGTAGAAAFGTLSTASGAGTYHYATGFQIVVSSGTVDAYLGFGTAITGADVLARGQFTPGGGIARDPDPAIRSSGTNSEICYKLGGAGTVMFAVNYWEGT